MSDAIKHVCMSVYLAARISHKPHAQISQKNLYPLHEAVARSSSDAMEYVMYFRFNG